MKKHNINPISFEQLKLYAEKGEKLPQNPIIITFDDGERSFSFARKPGADTCLAFEELPLDLIDEAKVFHFGTLSLTDEPARSATQKAVAYAKSKGKLITYDPNLRKPLWKLSTVWINHYSNSTQLTLQMPFTEI